MYEQSGEAEFDMVLGRGQEKDRVLKMFFLASVNVLWDASHSNQGHISRSVRVLLLQVRTRALTKGELNEDH